VVCPVRGGVVASFTLAVAGGSAARGGMGGRGKEGAVELRYAAINSVRSGLGRSARASRAVGSRAAEGERVREAEEEPRLTRRRARAPSRHPRLPVPAAALVVRGRRDEMTKLGHKWLAVARRGAPPFWLRLRLRLLHTFGFPRPHATPARVAWWLGSLKTKAAQVSKRD
jgi:hypothetical protein